MIPLYRCIEHWAKVTPDNVAIIFGDRHSSYAELDNGIARLAAVFQHDFGIQAGDRIAWLGNNSPRLIEALFACARIGAILVPLNWRLAKPELQHILDDAGPTVLIVGKDQLTAATALDVQPAICQPVHASQGTQTGAHSDSWPAIEELQSQSDAGHVAASYTGQSDLSAAPVLILYTSGTTGRPKGVVLTQDALAWSARNSVAMHAMTSRDRILMVLPMFHAGGFNIQTLPALSVGAVIDLQDGFDAGSVLRRINSSRPTLTGLVPAQIQAMIRHPDWDKTDLGCLRSITTGSTFVPAACIEAWRERGITALQVYGATETCAVAIHQTCENAAATAGSAGYAAAHCSIRIVDDDLHNVVAGQHGQILVKGPNVFKAYWRNPTATADALRDGWFHTGDIGFQRAAGSYVISGRQSDLIISGGENIYPAELQAILAEHPEIVEAAVIGLPDDRWGEVPVAVVVLANNSHLDQDSVLALFQHKLARFKQPKQVIIVNTLPRNAMGKVRKFELCQQITSNRKT